MSIWHEKAETKKTLETKKNGSDKGRGGLINSKLVVSPTFSPSSPDRHQSRGIVSTDRV